MAAAAFSPAALRQQATAIAAREAGLSFVRMDRQRLGPAWLISRSIQLHQGLSRRDLQQLLQ